MNNPWGDFHYVKGAGWQLFWRIPEECGGMELWFGHFNGKRVFWKASQPFAIVPYHHPLTVWTPPFPPTTVPAPPEFSFKDGLGPQCGGAGYTPLKWWAPNGSDVARQDDEPTILRAFAVGMERAPAGASSQGLPEPLVAGSPCRP